jgi:CRISPR/Cas system CSM-associated protein Csm2 small subunit
MYDRLQDTPVYKEMVRLATEKARAEALRESETMIQVALKTAEEARRAAEIAQKTTELALERELQEAEARRVAEAALEKERQEERKALRKVVLALVEKRFPTMLRLTRQITKGIEHTSTFQTLLLQISTASTPEEVHQYLLAIGEEEYEE